MRVWIGLEDFSQWKQPKGGKDFKPDRFAKKGNSRSPENAPNYKLPTTSL